MSQPVRISKWRDASSQSTRYSLAVGQSFELTDEALAHLTIDIEPEVVALLVDGLRDAVAELDETNYVFVGPDEEE